MRPRRGSTIPTALLPRRGFLAEAGAALADLALLVRLSAEGADFTRRVVVGK